MSRSKRTGASKHYAYLEFAHAEVAAIAAAAMHGYFLFAQQLVCRALKASEVHPRLFKGANRTFKAVPRRKIDAERQNRERTPAEHASRVARLISKDGVRRKRIAEAGIAYDYPPLAEQAVPAAKKTRF